MGGELIGEARQRADAWASDRVNNPRGSRLPTVGPPVGVCDKQRYF